MPLLRLPGFNLYSPSYVFLLQYHQFFGVTTKVLPILLPILCFTHKQSILNSTFILFVIKFFRTNSIFSIFLLPTKLLTSSPNISQVLSFFSFRTKFSIVSKPMSLRGDDRPQLHQQQSQLHQQQKAVATIELNKTQITQELCK